MGCMRSGNACSPRDCAACVACDATSAHAGAAYAGQGLGQRSQAYPALAVPFPGTVRSVAREAAPEPWAVLRSVSLSPGAQVSTGDVVRSPAPVASGHVAWPSRRHGAPARPRSPRLRVRG
jgi:hypothetical protein